MRLFYCLQGEASITILTHRRPPLAARGKAALSPLLRTQYFFSPPSDRVNDGGWSHLRLSDLEWNCGASLGRAVLLLTVGGDKTELKEKNTH